MANGLWKDILAKLEPHFSRPNYATWLRSTSLKEEGDGLITIAVANEYAKTWVEKNALSQIRQELEKHFSPLNDLRVVVAAAKVPLSEDLPLLQVEQTETLDASKTATTDSPSSKKFRPNYTFETFIVGNNNRLAFAAAQVVAERPGEAYNPLFIYGGVGLGKTHLMQAIGNEVLRRDPSKKIGFVSCETFTSEFIQALQNKTIDTFKSKYRSIDVLLVDDIQFLANKEGTQEEFFHTFNILHQANRQIVLTSDRVPKEIPNLEERLSSRLGWGMIADIQSPNFETRMAILQEKARERGINIEPQVLEYIANAATSNVRELEGSLTKLLTTAEIEKEPITIAFTERVLKDLTKHSGKNLTTKKVIQTVADYYDVEVSDLLGAKRVKTLVYPRQVAMYLLRERLKQSYPQIGEAFGGKDHTTVMHAVDKITKMKKADGSTEKDLNSIVGELRG
ncbi:MAG: chromosomal replication initiator protein DnaA [Candidatus Berkelbacteria bacterium]|nr:MAG: chromosomal replication initiator protein DnaA [Candidatus Berkelbacteria bacterium]QQG51719.1 MAG: chromosomal replication initiator protein DnaA [Candidatus Berkelbacteria bacterium]